jgi:hypothetical protein
MTKNDLNWMLAGVGIGCMLMMIIFLSLSI